MTALRLPQVVVELPAGLAALQREARGEGHSMLNTHAADWSSGKFRFDRGGEALFFRLCGRGPGPDGRHHR
ncbi:MAG: hypothetical protein ACREFQ_22140 [Stellaceae bacterium]